MAKTFLMPLTADAFTSGNVSQIVEAELINDSYKLPLQLLGNEGEWPDDKTLQLTYKSHELKKNIATIRLDAELDMIVCSACFGADKQRVKEQIKIILDLETTKAHMSV